MYSSWFDSHISYLLILFSLGSLLPFLCSHFIRQSDHNRPVCVNIINNKCFFVCICGSERVTVVIYSPPFHTRCALTDRGAFYWWLRVIFTAWRSIKPGGYIIIQYGEMFIHASSTRLTKICSFTQMGVVLEYVAMHASASSMSVSARALLALSHYVQHAWNVIEDHLWNFLLENP